MAEPIKYHLKSVH